MTNNNPTIIPNPIRCNAKEFPYDCSTIDIYDEKLEKSQEDVNKDVNNTIGDEEHPNSILGKIKKINDSIGKPNGIATLNEQGKVPDDQIPLGVDDESIEIKNHILGVKANGILPKHLNRGIVDDEDIHFNTEGKLQLKDKEYDPVNMSGLGRVYLRRTFIDSYPDNTWLYIPVNDVVYLLYSWQKELYAVYSYGKGLALADNLVVKPAAYKIEDIQSLVGERYLSFTEDGGVYTITKPDGSTITSTVLNNTNIYKLDFTAQRLFRKAHTVYYIQYDYDLLGQTVVIPEGCVLSFQGGSFTNGTIVGQDTYLLYCGKREDILDVTLEGTFTDNYYRKSETDTIIEEIVSRIAYGTEADAETKAAPNDYGKGDVFYVAESSSEQTFIDSIVYYIAKEDGLAGADLTDTELFESTTSVTDAVAISSSIKFSEVEELENYYDKTDIDSQTAINRNIATIMSLSAMPGLQAEVTVTSNAEYKLVYTDSQQRILLGKKQDNSWYYPEDLDAIVDYLISVYDAS